MDTGSEVSVRTTILHHFKIIYNELSHSGIPIYDSYTSYTDYLTKNINTLISKFTIEF